MKNIKIFAVLMLAVLMLSGCANQQTKPNATVTGESTFEVMPDEVQVHIAVETLADSAEESKTENAEISNRVMDELKKIGLKSENIETSDYSIYEQFEYTQTGMISKGWKTANTIKVKTENLEMIGEIIDAAVDAGATNVRNIYFTLKESTKQSQKAIALKNAGENAKMKAEQIAAGLGFKLGKVLSVQESNVYYYDYYPMRAYGDSMMESSEMIKSTPISPNKVTISASITVTYGIN